jgi:hypothetical protein
MTVNPDETVCERKSRLPATTVGVGRVTPGRHRVNDDLSS